MNWSERQKQAIEQKGNLIVSAAAGAGKTSVLTERICRLVVDEKVSVESLLVLTFTRAAASEMKQRILKKLHVCAEETADKEEKTRLLHEINAVSVASISTIDAFCTRILKRHGHTIGLDSGVRVADAVELAVISEHARDELLTGLAETEDESYRTLLSAFRSEEDVWKSISGLSNFLNTRPEPEKWLDSTLKKLSDLSFIHTLLDARVQSMQAELHTAVQMLQNERDNLSQDYEKVISQLDDELACVRSLLLKMDFDTYRGILSSIRFNTLRFPNNTDPSIKDPVQKTRSDLKDLISKQMKQLPRSSDDEVSVQLAGNTILNALFSTTRKYREMFFEMKQKKGVIDFSDVEHLAIRLLSEDRIAQEYRTKYRYIAVDEYQDSNSVQEKLLERITRGDNLFLVGDVKQSIYRFRAAEPGLFLDKLESYNGESGLRIDLNDNYRSSEEVINAVNTVFSAVMSEEVGEIKYDDRAALHRQASVPNGSAQLHLIFRDDSEESPAQDDSSADENLSNISEMQNAELEAQLIASIITDLTANSEYSDGGIIRSYRYEDFAILLRTNSQAQIFAETLARYGIPSFAQSSGGYFDATEVVVLLNCLRIIDNRKQDIPLLSTLRSGLFHFTAEELANIRIMEPDGHFYEAFLRISEYENADRNALVEKVKSAAAFLDTLYEESHLVNITDLLLRLIDSTGYYEQMGALPAGQQRQSNIDALIERARIFEAAGGSGIWKFLINMDAASDNADLGAAQEASGNVVKILSIHRSKGLEFPVVFLAQSARKFNLQSLSEKMLLHDELGVGLSYCKEIQGQIVRTDTPARHAIQQKLKIEQLSEEMRVLYVAMTRAKQRFYAIASGSNVRAQYENSILPAPSSRANTSLFWLLKGFRQNPDALPVFLHSQNDTVSTIPGKKASVDTREQASSDIKEILEHFSYTYPHSDALALPSKQTVSMLAHSRDSAGISASFRFDPPSFISEARPDAALRGTVVHLVLQHLPRKELSADEIRSFVLANIQSGIFAETDMNLIDPDAVSWFTKTDLWARAIQSSNLKREWRFTQSVPAFRVYETACTEEILLQGVIDCCFEENGGWILLDYKTDHIRPDETPESHAETHRLQLSMYANALEQLTGKRVLESYVVFLNLKKVVQLKNDAQIHD